MRIASKKYKNYKLANIAVKFRLYTSDFSDFWSQYRYIMYEKWRSPVTYSEQSRFIMNGSNW